MKTLNFTIGNINAIDSYLYAGNLYVFFENGRIAYISFTYLVRLLQDNYPHFKNLFQLAFLHNDYTNTAPGRLFLGINGVQSQIIKEWEKARKEVCFTISFESISRYFHDIGEWKSMPLDVRLYAMRLYMGCEDGLYESIIIQDEKAKVTPGDIDKVFDSKVVSVNARYGTIAISADREGLFSSNISDPELHVKIDERPKVGGSSLRTDWKDIDLLNYDAESKFQYIHNESQRTNKNIPNYYTLRKGGEYKQIVNFAIQVDKMDPLLDELDVKNDDLSYCFNSSSSAFIKLKDGSFFVTDFKQRTEGAYKRIIKEVKGCKKIMSSVVIPNGCVLRYYDRIVLYKKDGSIILHNGSTYGIRSYIHSNQYRSLVTINTEDSIGIHTTESFEPMPTSPENKSQYGRVKYSNIFRLKKHNSVENNMNEEDLPF